MAPVSVAAPKLRRGKSWGISGSSLLFIVCLPIFLYLTLPTLMVVPMALTKSSILEFPPTGLSLHSFGDVFRDSEWVDAFGTSLKVASLAIFVACLIGVPAAIGLDGAKFRGKGIVLGLILTPIVSPLILLALADYMFFERVQMLGSWQAIGLAHAVIGTPYVFLTTQASLAGMDPALVRSARSLGAGPLDVMRFAYWPTIQPGVLAGALFVFTVSFDEVIISLFLQTPEATTLAAKMFVDIQYSLTPKIAAVSSLLIGLATLALLAQTVIVLRWRSRTVVFAEYPDASAAAAGV